MRCSCDDESKGFWDKLNFSSILIDGGKTEMEMNRLVDFFHVKVRLIDDASKRCVVFSKPFLMYQESATPLNDHELVLHHLRNGKDFAIEMLDTYPYLLLKTFLFKESMILRDTSDIETVEDIFFFSG
jgi:hypothetical protein